MLTPLECRNIVGTREAWDDAMSRTFFKNGRDAELWDEPEEPGKPMRFKGFEKSWIRKDDRKYAKNIWA